MGQPPSAPGRNDPIAPCQSPKTTFHNSQTKRSLCLDSKTGESRIATENTEKENWLCLDSKTGRAVSHEAAVPKTGEPDPHPMPRQPMPVERLACIRAQTARRGSLFVRLQLL